MRSARTVCVSKKTFFHQADEEKKRETAKPRNAKTSAAGFFGARAPKNDADDASVTVAVRLNPGDE